jgi:hypothetical protein
MLQSTAAYGEVITYTLYNAPAVQDSKTLTGSITVDTTGLTPVAGGWILGASQTSSITAWQFGVTGGVSYSRSSTDANAFLQINGGGSFGMLVTSSTLSVEGGAMLWFGTDLSVNQTTIWWDNGFGPHEYGSNLVGNVSPNGWETSGEATLDAAFPSDGLGGWVMATAVPEPSTYAMLLAGVGCGAAGVISRRRGLRLSRK